MNRIKELEELIKKHDELYWSGNQEIADEEYDLLIEELKQLDSENALINRVNNLTNINNSNKVYHSVPMLSLDKVYTNDELFQWVKGKSRNKKEKFLIQPKYDGISGKIENYNTEKLILSTRGNGNVGENITDKMTIINIETNDNNKTNYLGEILIKKDDFKNIFSKIVSQSTKKCYKNPRNATAGIVGTDDITFFKDQGAKLTFVDYELYSVEVEAENFENSWEDILTNIEKLPYPMDGIVVKIKDTEYANYLGNTAHHPRSAIAFKFKNPKAKTTVVGLEWSFGKNYLTPVAILEPVDINGITVERVSVANYENVKKLNLKIGDTVTIERAGDVIPHIVEVENMENSIDAFIEKCPCCGSKLIVELPEILCPNENCKEKIIRKLLFSIRSIGIDGVGIPTITKIVNSTKIQTLYDFLKLDEVTLYRIGFGEKTSANIIKSIRSVSFIKDYQFITCLNISDVGEEVAKLMLEKYSIEDIMMIRDVDKLTIIKGVGSKTAIKVIEFFKKNLEYCMMLRSLFRIEYKPQTNMNLETVCFTGAMEQPRKYYEEIAIEKNYKPVNSVSKDLKYLVVADINSNSSKTQKAKKYGISIISVEEFLSL